MWGLLNATMAFALAILKRSIVKTVRMSCVVKALEDASTAP